MNLAFINACWSRRIILLVLPPHSTHRLQPLDVSLYNQLSQAYSNELLTWSQRSLSSAAMKKRHFLSIFRPAWRTVFTEKNIQRSFEKTGIWLYNPALVLGVITRPITPPQAIKASSSSPRELKTPRTSKSIRHFQMDYQKNPTQAKLQKLFKANEELSAQVSLDQHTKDGLIEALKTEKKCRNRGKRLNVLGKEHDSAILFHSSNVKLAGDVAAQKVELQKQEKARIEANKVAAAIRKQEIEAKRAEKALQAVMRRDNRGEIEAEERAVKQAQKKKETVQKKVPKGPVNKEKTRTEVSKAQVPKKKVISSNNVRGQGVVDSQPQKHSSSGRVIKQPVVFEKGV